MKKEHVQLTAEQINKEIDEHITEISREFKQGFEFLKKYPKTVTIFGSARFTEATAALRRPNAYVYFLFDFVTIWMF